MCWAGADMSNIHVSSECSRKGSVYCRIAIAILVVLLATGCSRDSNVTEANAPTEQPAVASAIDVDELIADLKPVIGFYPPAVEGEEELQQVEAKYDQAKKELDTQIEESPGDVELVLKRGRLQRMGHNLDKKGAWKGAEADFLAVLEAQPENKWAMLEIGMLYVNSEPGLAAHAEEYFDHAQAIHGDEPLEGAQNGLFFCYYYQAKFYQALEQAEHLTRSFPDVEEYQRFLSMINAVLKDLEGD